MVESRWLHGCSLALSSTLSPTVTSWCVFHADCAAFVPHTGVERHSACMLRAQPAVATELYQLTSSGGPHKRCSHTDGATVLCASHTPRYYSGRLHATLHLGVSQLCFTNHPFRRTVPHVFMKDLREAQSTFADAATQLSFAEFLESSNLSSTLPPRPQPGPTLLLDAATQTPPHSVAHADATTQLPLTEFFPGCIYSKDPLDRSVPPPAHGPAHSASLLQSSDIANINSLSSTSSSSGPNACAQVSRARLHSAPPPPPGPEGQALLGISFNILEDQASLCSPVKAAPVRPHLHSSTSVPSLQPHASTTQVGTHADRFISNLQKECKYRSTGNPPCHRCRPTSGTWSFSKASGPGPLHGQIWPSQT